jgi:hypothetical protein
MYVYLRINTDHSLDTNAMHVPLYSMQLTGIKHAFTMAQPITP